MPEFQRYAIYAVPNGALALAGATWLGWDIEHGEAAPQPQFAEFDISALTKRPRRYGFHGTLKPPFRLARDKSWIELSESLASFAATTAPILIGPLSISKIANFVALTPRLPPPALQSLAADIVRQFDPFRAEMTEAEFARRSKRKLSGLQEQHLRQWGYANVMDLFQFHMTLTGPIRDATGPIEGALNTHFSKALHEPFTLTDLCLTGEDESGQFHLIKRYSLAAIEP